MTRPSWTPAEDAEMIRLCGLGWNAAKIGAEIGRTKAGVNSRRHQLGLTEARPERKVTASLREKVRVGSFKLSKPGTAAPGGNPAPRHLVLDDASRSDGKTIEQSLRGCRWPIAGEGADTLFCCRKKARGSYCEDHAKRAYTRSQVPPADVKDLVRIFRRAA